MKACHLLLVLIVLLAGCTAQSLNRHTVVQSGSATDLRYREVIENLAMVYDNPATLPSYSVLFFGSADVTDTLPVTSGTTWTRTAVGGGISRLLFSNQSLDFAATRQVKKQWNLDPAVVPEKLYALRCACWWALYGPNNGFGNSMTLQKYDPNGNYPDGVYFDVADRLLAIPPGWLHCGPRCNVSSKTAYTAGCHNKWAWVEPEGLKGLSEFSLVVEIIVRADYNSVLYPGTQTSEVQITNPGPNNLNLKSITFYLDRDGFATPGQGETCIPKRARFDNTSSQGDLKSSITGSAGT